MKVCVIGLGYVGSVAAAGLAASNHDVTAVDIDRTKVDAFRRGDVPFFEPDLRELIGAARSHGTLRFLHTDEVSDYLGDVILVAAGTPPSDDGAADLSQVRSALAWIREKQPEGATIVMKSTVPPGAGVKLAASALGNDPAFEYVSNPEFLREGCAVSDWFHPDRIVIGADSARAAETVKALYAGLDSPFVLTDVTSAEMVKYASNAFLATKISFINEIAALCDRVGATIDDVATGVGLESRIGPAFMRAGVGYGGSCFPKDVRALDYLAHTNGHSFELLRAVITVNNRQRLLPLQALREYFGSLTGVTVGVLGLAFKPDTDDIREAPAVDLVRALVGEGAVVRVFDPMADPLKDMVLPASVELADDLASCAKGAQALVLMTEWPEIVRANWPQLAQRTAAPRLLFDGRNALDPSEMTGLGFQYFGVGRSANISRRSGDAAAANNAGAASKL